MGMVGMRMTETNGRSSAPPQSYATRGTLAERASQGGSARIALLLAGALIAALLLLDSTQPPGTADVVEGTQALHRASAASMPGPPPAPALPSASEAKPELPPSSAPALPASSVASQPLAPAHWSMADARVNGDPRTPPLHRATPESPSPSWQLSDHEGYRRRELANDRAVQRAFVEAANAELPKLEQWLALGRAQGVSAGQLAVAEEKIRRLKEQRELTLSRLEASKP
jgi:hypothetical protein